MGSILTLGGCAKGWGMHGDPIRFYNRYTGKLESEAVYGEDFLRWVYETGPGLASLELLVKRACFSKWYGWRMDKPSTRKRVRPFVERYGLDPSEFAVGLDHFQSFNEFFYRKLKAERRPIDAATDVLVFPADGRHFGFAKIDAMEGFYVKGQRLDLTALLGSKALADRYREGSLVFSRLCPVDYHRFHFPVGGVPGETDMINGPLYSVNPIALARQLRYLWENKRTLTRLQTERFGMVLLLEIGATCVGGIVQTFRPEEEVGKGAEKGYFRFGGSSTMVLFEPGRVRLDEDLLGWTSRGVETYARMGERAGCAVA